MKTLALVALCLTGILAAVTPQVLAATPSPIGVELESSPAGEASMTSELATASARQPIRITSKSSDLTETQGIAQGKLEQFVLQELPAEFSLFTFVRASIRQAVLNGVPANTIVLVLMFPLITVLIAASRHLVGLRGFGIFTPAVSSVALLATGLPTGFTLLFVTVVVATISRMIIRRLRLPYMPRTSLMLWFVAVAVLALLLAAPFLRLKDLMSISIFPILLIVLLAENFIEVQTKRSRSEAIEMTLETLILAVLGYYLMNLELVQLLVLQRPELVLAATGLSNIFLGKFGGLRILEYWRFRKILD